MKTIAKILSIAPARVGEAVYRELCHVYPEGIGPYTFSCVLPKDDYRVNAIQKVLSDAGFHPDPERGRSNGKKYWMKLVRVYSDDDLASFAYLSPLPTLPFSDDGRCASGRITLDASELDPGAEIAGAGRRWIIVSTHLKAKLEQAGFRDLVFRPTDVAGKDRERYLGKFWELTSDKFLPPLAPDSRFAHCITGESVSGDSPKAVGVRENEPGSDIPYEVEELHYQASALRAAGPFDWALTSERFSGGDSSYPVASQRVYQFCRERKLKIDWTPVRIDPD